MEKAYIAKQAILDANNNIAAYELLFRDHPLGITEFPSHLKATSQVAMNILTNIYISDVIPKNLNAYINIDDSVLLSGILDMLDSKIFVLEILETSDLSEKVIEKIIKYHKMGFKIAIDDFDCSAEMIKKFTPIFKHIDLIKIDVQSANHDNIKNLVPRLKKMGKKVLAEKVENKDEFLLFKKMGFDLFQGFYFDKPEVIEFNIHKEATQIVILQLIGLLKEDANTSAIDEFIRNRPDLSYKLIKYLNNNSNFETEVDSIIQVITLIGRDKLMRWLLLYLYSEVSTSPLSENVLILAQKRAEQMEEDAPAHIKDKAFLAGMFSMMDILFDTSMKELISHVKMDKEIVNLVTTRTGRFSDSLKRIEKKEKEDLKKIVNDNFSNIGIKDILHTFEHTGITVRNKKWKAY